MSLHHPWSKGLAGLIVSLTVGGCGSSPESGEEEAPSVEEQSASIVDGRSCSTKIQQSIVGLGLDTGKRALRDQSRCSGTLIAPNLVLTARHCVARLSGDNASIENECQADGSPNAHLQFGSASARTVYIFDDMTSGPIAKAILPVVPSEKSICNNDIALLLLDRSLDTKTPAPVRALASTKSAASIRVTKKRDPALVVAGYGLLDIGVENYRGCQQRQVRVLADGSQGVPHLGSQEFATDYGTCNGDSGGPVFDGAGRLVGVTSRGTAGTCRGVSIFPDLAFQRGTLRSALAKAGIR